jgi:hypothetical protein
MATSNSREGNVLLPPGLSVTTQVNGDEILASYARFTQKGYTIKGGQGIVPAGTVMYRETATKKYVINNSGNGLARGILRKAVDTGASGATAADRLGNIVVSGIVKLSLMKDSLGAAIGSGSTPTLTSVTSDLNARSDADRDFFIF